MKQRDYFSQLINNWNTRLQKRLISDDIRVRLLQYQFRNTVSHQTEDLFQVQAQIPLTSGIKFKTLNYIVTIELGGRNITVIVDTGSDLTWAQCQPCRLCYNQPEPLFNPPNLLHTNQFYVTHQAAGLYNLQQGIQVYVGVTDRTVTMSLDTVTGPTLAAS